MTNSFIEPSAYSDSEGRQTSCGRQRARGEARAEFARIGERTEAMRVFETGGLRLRFPNAAGQCEAVLINTGGGMAGGDRARIAVSVGPGGDVLFTTQSAEKVYRCEGEPAEVVARASVASGARLEWLPQETILFDNARFKRRIEVDLASDAALLLVEAVTFGRIAMGEHRIDADLLDSWRIRRDGRLVLAEELRLAHAGACLERPAVGRGARAIASILITEPVGQALLDKMRAALEEARESADGSLEAGATQIEGFVLARLLAQSPARLRAALGAVMMTLRGRAAPRVWS